MAKIVFSPSAGSYQYFSSTGTNEIDFNRTVKTLIFTTSGSVNMSFDGTNFFPLTNNTYQLVNLNILKLYFTGGTASGYGISF